LQLNITLGDKTAIQFSALLHAVTDGIGNLADLLMRSCSEFTARGKKRLKSEPWKRNILLMRRPATMPVRTYR
jgi:hypothetical protein